MQGWRSRFVLFALVGLAAVLFAAGCDDDDDDGGTGPQVDPFCHGLLPNEIVPTDEDGSVLGPGGEDQWCPATGGTEPLTPGWEPAVPNPFFPSTRLKFTLPEASDVLIEIFDDDCHRVRTLYESPSVAGDHYVLWNCEDDDGQQVPDGYYVCVLTVGDFECAGVLQVLSNGMR